MLRHALAEKSACACRQVCNDTPQHNCLVRGRLAKHASIQEGQKAQSERLCLSHLEPRLIMPRPWA